MRSFLAVLSVLVVVGAGGVLLHGPDGAASAGAGQTQVDVTRATAVCPDPREGDEDNPTDVHLMTPESAASRGPGRAVVSELAGGKSRKLLQLDETGRPEKVHRERTDASAVTVEATGAMAAGLVAEQHITIPSGPMRGFAAGECPRPDNDFWFLGGGSEVGQRTSVVLTNTDLAPAQVEVTVYGQDGPVDTSAADGVVVAARDQKVLRLDALASGSDVTAVRVQTQSGRVAAVLLDTSLDGLTSRGTDWVPRAAAPSRRAVVPGLPAGDGQRRLHLLAPGRSDAVVELRLVTPARTFAPTGHEVIDVPAGRVVSVDLTDALARDAAAVRVTSDVPVLAGAEVRTGSKTGTSDVGYSAAVPPLGDVTSTVGVASGAGSISKLVLSAPRGMAAVEVSSVPGSGGKARTRSVRVPAGSTRSVALKGSLSGQAVVLTATGGPVYGARVIEQKSSGSPLLSVLPLFTSPSVVSAPDVTADLSTGLRGRG